MKATTEEDQAAREAYILLLLSDANLPTGSFVASSGLESYIKHGFFASSLHPEDKPIFAAVEGQHEQATPPRLVAGTIDFLRDSVGTYARSAGPFIRWVHQALQRDGGAGALEGILQLDALYEAMTLNHVARRASKAQGVALLTLHSKVRPNWIWCVPS